jgi:beta-glucosidase-like glycosyl hydrolase
MLTPPCRCCCCCCCRDPYLTSQYAIHFIKGVQGVDPTGRGYLQAAATPKHYAGYHPSAHRSRAALRVVETALPLPTCTLEITQVN